MDFIHFITSLISFSWVVQLLEEALAVVLLCRGFNLKKEKIFPFIRDWVILFILFFLICFALLYWNPGMFVVFRYLTFFSLVMIYMLVCSESSLNGKRIMSFSMSAGAMCISSLAKHIGELCSLTGMMGMVSSLVLALLLPFALLLRKFVPKDYENALPDSGVLLIVTGSLTVLGLLFFEALTADATGTVISGLYILAYSGVLAMTIAGVYSIGNMCRSRRDILQLQTETVRLRSEKEMSAMNETRLEEYRFLRHEMKNQYAYMQLLLEEEKYEELKQYCQKLTAQIPGRLEMIDCGNQSMNALLNMWISKAKQTDLVLNTNISVPSQLPFSEDDLFSLLSNVLENAIEGCRQAGAQQIQLDIRLWQDYLCIVCSNPTVLEKVPYRGNSILTTKQDNTLHGYGTKIISRIAAQYNGMVDFSVKEKMFTVKILLDMHSGKEKLK